MVFAAAAREIAQISPYLILSIGKMSYTKKQVAYTITCQIRVVGRVNKVVVQRLIHIMAKRKMLSIYKAVIVTGKVIVKSLLRKTS